VEMGGRRRATLADRGTATESWSGLEVLHSPVAVRVADGWTVNFRLITVTRRKTDERQLSRTADACSNYVADDTAHIRSRSPS